MIRKLLAADPFGAVAVYFHGLQSLQPQRRLRGRLRLW
jgi:hypothetical protein